LILTKEIWQSFRALPLWVQLWMALWLVPVNAASLLFLDQSMGVWIALLAAGAVAMNGPVLLIQRGFSKGMALPHLVPWGLLVLILIFAWPDARGAYEVYLWLLLVTNLVSLGFDIPDAIRWIKGDRMIAGKSPLG